MNQFFLLPVWVFMLSRHVLKTCALLRRIVSGSPGVGARQAKGFQFPHGWFVHRLHLLCRFAKWQKCQKDLAGVRFFFER